MLFADAADVHPAIWGSLSSLATALGMWFLQWHKEQRADKRDSRKDAIDEWIELHKNDKDKIEKLILDIGRLNSQMNDLQDEHMECKERCAELTAQIMILKNSMRTAGLEVPSFDGVKNSATRG